MNIRKAESKDAKAIFSFIEQLEETSFDYALFERYYKMNIANKNYVYLVAETDNKVVGYISCHGQILLHHVDEVFEVQELFVKENYRQMGMGKALVQALEVMIINKGFCLLEVTPNVKRIRAHHFYSECGFVQTHVKFTKELK